MAEYKLTQMEVQTAGEQGSATVLAILLGISFNQEADRDAAVQAFETSAKHIIAQLVPDSIPAARRAEYLRATEDRALKIIRMAKNLRRVAVPPGAARLQ